MRKRSALTGGLALLAAGALAAACGGGGGNGVASKSPSQILQTALSSLRSATSVTVVGTVTESGQQTSVDGVFYANGDFDGSVGIKGSTVKLVKIGQTDYINAPEAFWNTEGVTGSTATRLANKWFSTPNSTADINDLSIGSLADSLSSGAGTVSAGTTSTIDGQAAVSITSSKGGTLWVATTGTPYPIALTGTGSGEVGNITFSNWNGSATPTAPTGAVAASSLTGGTGTTGATSTSVTGGTGTTTTSVTGATGSTTTSTTGATGTTGG
jgi:hypothetical protein